MKRNGAIGGLGVRFQPGAFVYVYENLGAGGVGRDLYTAVIQNVAFVNKAQETVSLDAAEVVVRRGDNVVQSQLIGRKALSRAAQQLHAYQAQGVLDAYDFQFQTKRYLPGIAFAQDADLVAGSALVVPRTTLLFQGLPDTITVSVSGRSPRGDLVSAENSLEVVHHRS